MHVDLSDDSSAPSGKILKLYIFILHASIHLFSSTIPMHNLRSLISRFCGLPAKVRQILTLKLVLVLILALILLHFQNCLSLPLSSAVKRSHWALEDYNFTVV